MSDETKWTHGEWHQAHREKSDGMWSTEVFDENGETIATVAWHPVKTSWGLKTDRSANACLIAAAPDLYVALDYVAGFAWNDEKTFRDHPAVKAALAKARGES